MAKSKNPEIQKSHEPQQDQSLNPSKATKGRKGKSPGINAEPQKPSDEDSMSRDGSQEFVSPKGMDA